MDASFAGNAPSLTSPPLYPSPCFDLIHKSVLHSPFYSPSSTFSFLPNAAHPPYWILSPQLSLLAPPLSHFTPLLASAHI